LRETEKITAPLPKKLAVALSFAKLFNNEFYGVDVDVLETKIETKI
jgi:hypothetical protein